MRFEFGTLKISLFSSIFNNCDFYLCDLFGVWSAGLQDFHLLVHIGTVHPFCSSGFFVRLVEASKQSSKWTRKAKNQSLNKSMNFKSNFNLPIFVEVFFLKEETKRGHSGRKLDVTLWFGRLLFDQRLFVNIACAVTL